MTENTNMDVWVKELLAGLDNLVDEELKRKLLERCGVNCPFTHLPEQKLLELRDQAGSEQEFLDRLCEVWRLIREGDDYYVVFDQCYCPLVNKDIEGASSTMCYCTMGNLKHKFAIGLGRQVEVEMQKTVLSGDGECRFKILM